MGEDRQVWVTGGVQAGLDGRADWLWLGRAGRGIGVSLVNRSQYLLLLRKDWGWEGLTSSHRNEPLHCLGDEGAPCGYRSSPGQTHIILQKKTLCKLGCGGAHL